MRKAFGQLGVDKRHQEAGDEHPHTVHQDRDRNGEEDDRESRRGMLEQQSAEQYSQTQERGERPEAAAGFRNEQVMAGEPNDVPIQVYRNAAGR